MRGLWAEIEMPADHLCSRVGGTIADNQDAISIIARVFEHGLQLWRLCFAFGGQHVLPPLGDHRHIAWPQADRRTSRHGYVAGTLHDQMKPGRLSIIGNRDRPGCGEVGAEVERPFQVQRAHDVVEQIHRLDVTEIIRPVRWDVLQIYVIIAPMACKDS